MTLSGKRIATAYLFLALPLVFFIGVRLLPMVYSLAMSATNWGLLVKHVKFVGFGNYVNIFTDDTFLRALLNTAEYAAIGTPAVIILSFIFARELNNITKFRAAFRLVYVLPYITPIVAVSWVWRWILQPVPFGSLNAILVVLGIPAGTFLNSTKQALFSILGVNVWVELGYCVTIFLAGMQTIPQEYVEAAKIDGAGSWTVLRKITVPLLLPVTLFLAVIEAIQFLRIFTLVYNMSTQAGGGPLNSTVSVALYIYRTAFTKFDLGTAAASSLVLFVIIMAVTIAQLRLFDKRLDY
ncbi:MAG TPA: sugar ABC transporter permease [Spirochaetia bacterium]|nr:sugar ABC transporter permease [Spirochaetia bacterium]